MGWTRILGAHWDGAVLNLEETENMPVISTDRDRSVRENAVRLKTVELIGVNVYVIKIS